MFLPGAAISDAHSVRIPIWCCLSFFPREVFLVQMLSFRTYLAAMPRATYLAAVLREMLWRLILLRWNCQREISSEFLDRRRGKLSGVVISGGEPAVHVDLPEFIARIREKGFLVKLDTNGMNPGMLRRIIEASLVDYVAMDVKNSPKKYAVTCGFASDPSLRLWRRAEESISVLMSGHVPYEFRTTVAIGLHTDEDILEMAQHIRGARAWCLQQFIDGGSLVGAAGNPALRLVSRLLRHSGGCDCWLLNMFRMLHCVECG